MISLFIVGEFQEMVFQKAVSATDYHSTESEIEVVIYFRRQELPGQGSQAGAWEPVKSGEFFMAEDGGFNGSGFDQRIGITRAAAGFK